MRINAEDIKVDDSVKINGEYYKVRSVRNHINTTRLWYITSESKYPHGSLPIKVDRKKILIVKRPNVFK